MAVDMVVECGPGGEVGEEGDVEGGGGRNEW